MKVSEVIEKLNKLKEKFGDLECMVYMEDIDGTETGLDEINEIENTLEDEPVIYIAHRNEEE